MNQRKNITPAGLDRNRLHDKKIISSMERIPREEFLPVEQREFAYQDRALPIGYKQTISQPFIVALMIQEANIHQGSKVLEIGTGSGYQAAVLAYLGAHVFSIEIVPELAERARITLARTGFGKDIKLRLGDGSTGWPEEASFDAILVSAACPEIPRALCEQLRVGGKMVIPISNQHRDDEELIVITKKRVGYFEKSLGPVRFVPLTHYSSKH